MIKRLMLLGIGMAVTLACEAGPSDSEISRAVRDQLSAELSGSQIEVSSVDGVVTLRGRVESEAERNHAEAVAGRVDGVQAVENQLEAAETTPPAVGTPPPGAEPAPEAPGEDLTEAPEALPEGDVPSPAEETESPEE
jgi:hypothetical protein